MSVVKELINLSGRRALITGANGKLGRVMSSTLAELGCDLILVDLERASLSSLCKDLTDAWGVQVEYYDCNLEEAESRAKLIAGLKIDWEQLNILVNNAALVGGSDLKGWSVPFEQQTIDTWRRALEVNLTAIFDLCQGLAPLLRKAKGASIVNIGSIYGFEGPDWSLYKGTTMSNPAAYAVSKGGLLQFTRWLSTTLSPSVRVNAISPGGIFRNQPHEFVMRYEKRTPLGRMAHEEDFCGAIAYLASDLSSYVTGQNLIVDGGWSMW